MQRRGPCREAGDETNMETVTTSQSDIGPGAPASNERPLIYRQSRWTRLTHWLWAISLFFMLLSGLQIFNARPQLYIGKQSGFGYNNTDLRDRRREHEHRPARLHRNLRQAFRHDRRARLVGSGRQ